MSDPTDILSAYDAAVRLLVAAGVPALRRVAAYEGEMADLFDRIKTEPLPVALVICTGAEIVRTDADTRDWQSEWAVVVVAGSLRSREEAARGAADRAGAYALVHQVVDVLDGARVGSPSAEPTEVQAVRLVDLPTPQLAAWQVTAAARLTEYLSTQSEE